MGLISIGQKNLYQCFFTEQLLPDIKQATLLFTFLITILQSIFFLILIIF